jgi:hypothetical protein
MTWCVAKTTSVRAIDVSRSVHAGDVIIRSTSRY